MARQRASASRLRASPGAAAERLDRSELDRMLGFRLREALAETERAFNACFREEEITSGLFAILLMVDANPGCRPSELCRELLLSPTNIVPYLDELVRRGLLSRQVGVSDRRSKLLTLTAEGRAYTGRLRLLHRRIAADQSRRLGEGEIDRLLSLLAQVPLEAPAAEEAPPRTRR